MYLEQYSKIYYPVSPTSLHNEQLANLLLQKRKLAHRKQAFCYSFSRKSAGKHKLTQLLKHLHQKGEYRRREGIWRSRFLQ